MRHDLKAKLARYDRIFLFCRRTECFEAAFAQSAALRKNNVRVWIYSGSKVTYPEDICVGRISPTEEKELLDIYHLYECSDRFQVVSRSQEHGSLFCYLEQGLLSTEEMIEALLY